MSIERVVPDIMSQRMDESRKFYTEFLGFDVAMDMGWVLTFASPQNPTAQITVMQRNEKAGPQPNMSIEVEELMRCIPRRSSSDFRLFIPSRMNLGEFAASLSLIQMVSSLMS
jgi:hypothetical protein